MPIRQIEMIVPAASAAALDELADSPDILGQWTIPMDGGMVLIRMLVETNKAEVLLDDLQSRFSQTGGYRVVMLAVEATLPRPTPAEGSNATTKSPERISREELYTDIVGSAEISKVFAAQAVLATVVAAIGLMRNDTAVLIGAMVIAPLLGPNMVLCLATTLGDIDLIWKSLKTNFFGLGVALLSALAIGFLFPIDAGIESIVSRTKVSAGDIILALASGCAGVLAFTSGVSSALIGVMVAVALLPPFAVFGLMLASGNLNMAGGALLLVATNVICVNLAGVLTFFAQHLRPRTWYEAKRAKKATRIAVTIWSSLLLILLVLIYVGLR